jgi:hypothetical protein
MRVMLEGNHNTAHNYIGGTIGDPHTPFVIGDPFVFLIHSNVDRLYATWQLQPEKAWRLDPDRIYGSESDTATDRNLSRSSHRNSVSIGTLGRCGCSRGQKSLL